MEFHQDQVQQRRLQQRFRHRRETGNAQGAHIDVDGRRYLNFCSNNYLGLANHPQIIEAAKDALDTWGLGSGASPLVTGYTEAHQQCEAALASWLGRERALLFSSGYAANQAALHSLGQAGGHIIGDELNHASLIDGARISRAHYHFYQHKNYGELAELAAQHHNGLVIASDGTFSMDGDCCDVLSLADIAGRHNAYLLIDEAHSLGVLGEEGSGLTSPLRDNEHCVVMGTLGKALGSSGAFLAGSDEMIEFFIQHARHYMFSTAAPAAVAAATIAAIELARNEHWRRNHLRELLIAFRQRAAELGLELLPSDTPIQPILCRDEQQALAWSAQLQQQECLVSAIRPPSVPQSRLRVTLSAAHSFDHVEQLLNALGTLR